MKKICKTHIHVVIFFNDFITKNLFLFFSLMVERKNLILKFHDADLIDGSEKLNIFWSSRTAVYAKMTAALKKYI